LFILRTGREAYPFEIDDPLGCQLQGIRRAPRGTLLQIEGGGTEVGALARRVRAAIAGGDLHDRILVLQTAVGLESLGLGVVLHFIRVYPAFALAHADIALENRVAVETDRRVVAVYIDGAGTDTGLALLRSLLGLGLCGRLCGLRRLRHLLGCPGRTQWG